METKLNKEELKELVGFIRKKGFTEVDVQLEILDHFACKVEEIRAEQPSIELSKAMTQAHASFGVMGFSTIEESYAKLLGKQLFAGLRIEFFRFLQTWAFWAGLFVFVAGIFLLLNSKNEDLILGVMLGFFAAALVIVFSVLMKRRPLCKNYMVYKSAVSLIVPSIILTFNMGLNAFFNFGNTVLAPWKLIIAFSLIFLLILLVAVFDRMLGRIVDQVDQLELMANKV